MKKFLIAATLVLSTSLALAQSSSSPGRGGIAGGASATLQGTPGSPTATTSTSGVMMGVGGVCKLTPLYSTRVQIDVRGTAANNTATGIPTIGLRYGTGTAPTNGTAVTGVGTVVSPSTRGTVDTANGLLYFANGGIITGLTPGTAYWFDLTVSTNGGTVSLSDLSCNAFEF